jgi:hypothetical protein
MMIVAGYPPDFGTINECMKKREAELKAEVDRWLDAAEAADRKEDELYGERRGDETSDWGVRQAQAA